MDAVKIYDDAVRRLEKSEITLGEFEKLIEPLRNVSEQKKGKWIPCKERLPDKDGLYLVTYFSGHARWTGTDEFLVDGTEESHWKYANIIAWQPLPKPFREGGDYA